MARWVANKRRCVDSPPARKARHDGRYRDENHEDIMIRHVLFSRRRNHYANKVMAALQGDHGRAIQGVCEHLGDEAWVSVVITNDT